MVAQSAVKKDQAAYNHQFKQTEVVVLSLRIDRQTYSTCASIPESGVGSYRTSIMSQSTEFFDW